MKKHQGATIQKWNKLFTRKGGKLYWKESRGRKAAGSEAGTNHGDGYKTVRIDGKAVYVHRIVKEMSTGKPVKKELDHKNRKRSDNRPSNLKPATRSQNNKNRSTWKRKK
jgi:hypothetical protein